MLRSALRAAVAALAVGSASVAVAEEDPRVAAITAAIPAEIEGYTRSMDDMVDLSEDDGSLIVGRILSAQGVRGPIILQVRLWTPEDTEADAANMLSPDDLDILKGQIVEVKGHPAFFMPGAMGVYPGRPDSGVTVMVGGLTDAEQAIALASLVDYDALLAIE